MATVATARLSVTAVPKLVGTLLPHEMPPGIG
jgi:hypothetical protein